jgi:hypothetical protein
MRVSIRDRIITRVDLNVTAVRTERQRLHELAQQTNEETAFDHEKFLNAERERIRRMENRNKREAERLLQSLFIELELQEEERERQEREFAEREEHERELKKKRILEQELQRRKEAENAARETARLTQLAKAESMARQRLADNEARRIAIETANHKKHEEMEIERRQKLDKAAQTAREAERKRQEDADTAKSIREERDRVRSERREQEHKERLAENLIRSEQKQRHVATIQRTRIQAIEKTREACEGKWEDARIRFEEWRKKQEEMLAEKRKEEAAKIEEGNRVRAEKELKKHEIVLETWIAKEEKSAEWIKSMQAEGDQQRKTKAVDHAFSIDDHRARQARVESKQVAGAVEKVIDYEKKLQKLAFAQRERKRQFEEAEMRRMKLENEKNRMLANGAALRELVTKNPKELQAMADSLGIDLEEVKRKAKETRRKRGTKLPPIQEQNVAEQEE